MPVEIEDLPPLVFPPQEPEGVAPADAATVEPEDSEDVAEPDGPADDAVAPDLSEPEEPPPDEVAPTPPDPELPPQDAAPGIGPPDAPAPAETDSVAPAPVAPPIPEGPATMAPLGEWVGPGRHCVAGFVVTLPQGVEGLSFALGMEFRTTAGQDLGELVTGAADGAPGFDSFIEGIISHEGCLPTSTLTIDGPAAVPNSPFHALRAEVTCSLPDGTFGMDITRFTFNDGERVALLLLLFGSNGWEIANSRIPPEEALAYAAAAPLFDIMVEQMDYCPLDALDEP
ncbi:MAG: hypothetical protein H6843_01885 [Rhodospirillaceae bacterium]|nr:hypothetical protein [Rhodospirillaceae bacterium]